MTTIAAVNVLIELMRRRKDADDKLAARFLMQLDSVILPNRERSD
jgi:hypothetical protein